MGGHILKGGPRDEKTLKVRHLEELWMEIKSCSMPQFTLIVQPIYGDKVTPPIKRAVGHL